MAKLGEVCIQITDGSHNPPSGVEQSEYLMLSSKNIDDDFITLDSPRFLSHSDYIAENKRTTVSEGDLLMTIVGTIGRVAIVPKELKGICLQRSVAVIKPNKEIINNRYLMYQLQNMRSFLEKEARGVAQKGIYLKQVSQLDIKLPEIEQQKQIVKVLDKVSKLISLRKQQLAKLDELVKARFVEKSKEWQAVPGQLNEFLEDITYGFTNPMPDAEEGPWKVTAKDVVNGHINILTARKTTNEAFERLTNKSKPRKGDVLLTKDGTLGRVAVVDVENLCVNQSVAVMRCNNKIYPEFLAMILQMPEYQRKLLEDSGGGTIKHLYITKVDKMLISVPDLVIQKDLLMFAKRVEQQKQTVQQSLEKLELMKKALMQEYFG